MKKTFVTKPSTIERKWYVIDAEGKNLGRLSTTIANLLRGKNKTCFSPSVDCGDYVIVVNTAKVAVTGNKLETKKYYNYSGYIGGMKELTMAQVIEKNPNRVIEDAVKGMLPKNRLANDMIKKLKLYAGPEHDHSAQKPVEYKVEA